LIWQNREVLRVVLSEMLVSAELREFYLRRVVATTMGIAEEHLWSRAERGRCGLHSFDVAEGGRHE
jgi:hypothetical protein